MFNLLGESKVKMAPTGWLHLDYFLTQKEKFKNPNSTAAWLGRVQFRHLKTKGPLFAESSAALLAASQMEPPKLAAAGSIPAR